MEVFLDSMGALYFRTKADRIRDLLKEEIEEFAAVAPAVVVVKVGHKESNGTNGPRPTPPAPSAPPALPAPALDPALQRECDLVWSDLKSGILPQGTASAGRPPEMRS